METGLRGCCSKWRSVLWSIVEWIGMDLRDRSCISVRIMLEMTPFEVIIEWVGGWLSSHWIDWKLWGAVRSWITRRVSRRCGWVWSLRSTLHWYDLPFYGDDSMRIVLAIHLWHSENQWLVNCEYTWNRTTGFQNLVWMARYQFSLNRLWSVSGWKASHHHRRRVIHHTSSSSSCDYVTRIGWRTRRRVGCGFMGSELMRWFTLHG